MARTKGATNKPKFFSASIKDINIVFGLDAIIDINIKYLPLFIKMAKQEEISGENLSKINDFVLPKELINEEPKKEEVKVSFEVI